MRAAHLEKFFARQFERLHQPRHERYPSGRCNSNIYRAGTTSRSRQCFWQDYALRAVFEEAGFSHFRRATESPLNMILEARA